MRRVLVIGATSAIAQVAARCFAADGDHLFLVARDPGKLEAVKADLKVRGASQVESLATDANRFDRHGPVVQEALKKWDGLDVVLIAYGTLPDQKACEADFAMEERELETNFLSPVSFLTLIANEFERAGAGTIAVISSVAGDRGRQSNYVYGAAKGGLTIFLQGLRNRLAKSGVHVLTVKPGFVDTPMTASFPKNALFASPETVGRGIYKAILKKKDVVYLPWFWRWIMMVVTLVPERIFKKLGL